jgi:hypothetical protein
MLETFQKDKLKLFIHKIINYDLKSKVFYNLHKYWLMEQTITLILHNYSIFLFNRFLLRTSNIFYILR